MRQTDVHHVVAVVGVLRALAAVGEQEPFRVVGVRVAVADAPRRMRVVLARPGTLCLSLLVDEDLGGRVGSANRSHPAVLVVVDLDVARPGGVPEVRVLPVAERDLSDGGRSAADEHDGDGEPEARPRAAPVGRAVGDVVAMPMVASGDGVLVVAEGTGPRRSWLQGRLGGGSGRGDVGDAGACDSAAHALVGTAEAQQHHAHEGDRRCCGHPTLALGDAKVVPGQVTHVARDDRAATPDPISTSTVRVRAVTPTSGLLPALPPADGVDGPEHVETAPRGRDEGGQRDVLDEAAGTSNGSPPGRAQRRRVVMAVV